MASPAASDPSRPPTGKPAPLAPPTIDTTASPSPSGATTAAAAELGSATVEERLVTTLGLPLSRGMSAEPGAEDEDWEELSGEKPASGARLEERARFLAEKSKDPAILVNIPRDPAAQDYEVAETVQEPSRGPLGDDTVAT